MDDLSTTAGLSAQDKRALLARLLEEQASRTKSEHPLSYNQLGLWFAYQQAPQSAAFNIAFAARIRSQLDVTALREAFQTLVTRHAPLRTTFTIRDGVPIQEVWEFREVAFEVRAAWGWGRDDLHERVRAAYQRPFDLENGPLLRVTLFQCAERDAVLLLTIHHIVFDGGRSLLTLLRELAALYQARASHGTAALAWPAATYADWAQRQRGLLDGPDGDRLWEYWRNQLGGELAPLDLPTDRPRPRAQAFRGVSCPLSLSAELTQQLKALAQAEHATLFMTLLAAFHVLLYRYTGQADIVVGSPTPVGRDQPAFADLVGYFINVLPLRANLAGNLPFSALLRQVRQVVLDGLDHRDFPLTLLVERLQPDRDPGRPPLIQVVFTFHNQLGELFDLFVDEAASERRIAWGGLELEPFQIAQQEGQFDLSLEIGESGGRLYGRLKYNTDLFDEGTVARMARHFEVLLAAVAADPQQGVADLELLTADERRQLLEEWSGGQAGYSSDHCLHQIFEAQVERAPNAVAVVFGQQRLTYRELNERANQLAHYLRGLGVGPDMLVGLCVERSPEMIVGVLGILKAGGAYLPLDPAAPQERLAFMLADAEARVLVTQAHLLDRAMPAVRSAGLRTVCLDTDRQAIAQASVENPPGTATAASLAYVIYTSGSTGKPKGVLVEHANVARLFAATERWFGFDDRDAWTLFHSYAFDFSVWEIWGALLYGGRLVVVPYLVSRTPEAFYDLLAAERVTILNQTPSAFGQLDEVDARLGKDRHLSLRLVIFGGEALEPQRLAPWFERHGDRSPQLVNMYGITETTVHVTYRPLTIADVTSGASVIGRPIPDLRVYILDEQGQPAPVGVVGELYVGGAGLSRGYLNRPELTAERFIPNPFVQLNDRGSKIEDSGLADQGKRSAILGPLFSHRLYKTGDAARYLRSGEIEYRGRLDDQVKIRGFRVELGEIESVLRQHPAVRACAVTTLDNLPGGTRLVAYVVPAGDGAIAPGGADQYISDLRGVLRRQLPDYMLPAAFVVLAQLPLTQNGKLDRGALPRPDLAGRSSGAGYTPPRTDLELRVADTWAEVLGLDRPGIDDDFFELGGHSLLATQLVSRLRDALQVELPLSQLFASPTVRELAAAVEVARRGGLDPTSGPLTPVDRSGPLPLSFAQQQIWLLDRLGSGSAYNIPAVLRLSGALDVPALERALQEIVRRHEILRTTYTTADGEVRQVIADASLRLHVVDLGPLGAAEKQAEARRLEIAEARRPFDLAHDLMLRATLLRLEGDVAVLLLTMHHIAADGWSLGVFVGELAALYGAFSAGRPSVLSALPIQYADYAHWQRQWLSGAVLERHLQYWQAQLAGIPAFLKLPTDHPRPATPTFEGGLEEVAVDAAIAERLRAIGRQRGATLFMTLLAAFQVLLARYSGQLDLVVGSPIANRSRPEIEPLIGFFANTLPLRADLGGDPTFLELLERTVRLTRSAYEHQDLPFEKLVEVLQPERSADRNPLFQVLFVLQNAPIPALALDGLEISQLALTDSQAVRLDLELHVWEDAGGLRGYWAFNRNLFEAATIARMAGHLCNLLAAIAADPALRISELPLLGAAERRQLLSEWSGCRSLAVEQQCIDELFEAQVERAADAIALICENERISYRELNARANRLAHHLRALGLGPGGVVALYGARSPEMVIATLAALKAGGAYLALDQAHPPAFSGQLLAHAGATVLLGESWQVDRLLPELAEPGALVVARYDSDRERIARQSDENPARHTGAADVATITYGSEQPVYVEHRAVVRQLRWLQDQFALADADVVLHTAPRTLDAAIWETLWPLCYGARLAIAPEGAQDDPAALLRLVERHAVSLIHLAPSALARLMAALPASAQSSLISLRWVLCGGEPLRAAVVAGFFGRSNAGLCHLYGVPEMAATVAAQICDPTMAGDPVAIGRPTGQAAVYILDEHRQLVPVGVVGEIWVAWQERARGDQTDPLASSRLVANPFAETSGGWMFDTRDRGRWRSDGTIELVATAGRHFWLGGARVEPAAIEAALLAEPSVAECVVDTKERQDAVRELVAYVVPAGAFAPDRLRAALAASLPPTLLPDRFVPLSSLPLTATGDIDMHALGQMPVVDADLARSVEERLQALLGLEQVAVVIERPSPRPPALHISDLLPTWQGDLPGPPASPAAAPATLAARPEPAEPRAMALSDGGPLTLPADAPRTLSDALVQTAARYKDTGIVYVQADGSVEAQTYPELLEAARRVLTGLSQAGLKAGDKTILQIASLDEFFPVFWGCVLGGITPVTVAIAPTYGVANGTLDKLYNTWELLDRPPIIASDHLVDPLVSLGSFLPMEPVRVLAAGELRDHEPAASIHPAQPDEIVFLQLTSGSTGTPKAIQETHRGIICHIHGSSQFNDYRPGAVSLNWLPMDHVVPMLTYHLKDVYSGYRQIQAPTALILSNPARWLDLIEAYRVTHTWSPNFGFKLVSDALAQMDGRSWDLSSVEFFMNAGEQVTLAVVRDFLAAVAPFGVASRAMQPAFGMAEVCTCMTYQNAFDLESGVHWLERSSLEGRLRSGAPNDPATLSFVDLGPPMPGVQIRIADQGNQLLPEGVIGRLQIKGAVVTPGYFNNPAANQEAFVGDGWFNTGDLGFLLDGRLTITGREKEMIIIRGANYYCYEIEDVVNRIDGVKPTFVAACAVEGSSSGTEELAIFFSPLAEELDVQVGLIQTIRAQVASNLGISPAYVIPVAAQEFPKTTSGKIQRVRLKKSLAAGDFRATQKAIDIHTQNANTLPSWFYRVSWRPRAASATLPQLPVGPYLVFVDRLGLGEALCAELERQGRACVRVEAGDAFAQLGDRHYRIAPDSPEHYERVVQALAGAGRSGAQVLHLWTYDEYQGEPGDAGGLEHAQERGSYSLLLALQALAKAQEQLVHLYVVSSYCRAVAPNDRVAYEKAPLLGLIKTMPQELPWLRARHVDMPPGTAEANAAHILREIGAVSGDAEVAYRDRRRLSACLEHMDLAAAEKHDLPFKHGGMYLVSGGLGGIGVEIARYLLAHYQARLLLVGRTPLHGDQDGSPGQKDAVAQRRAAYQELARLGGSVSYHDVDICDMPRLRQAVEQARSQWGCDLDGVIHLAGIFQERMLVDETRDGLAASLRPKMLGAWSLARLLEGVPDGLLISSSSVNGFFGGVGVGAYAAANSFLMAFADAQQARLRSYCFSWSMWDELGISRNYLLKDASRQRGYQAISPSRGLVSLLAGLSTRQPQLLVGLDGGNQRIRHKIAQKPHGLQALTAYFTAADRMPALEISDRFGRLAGCDFVRLEALPLTEAGALDRERLVAQGERNGRAAAERVAPRTEAERRIAQIWEALLGLPAVGIHESFFALGGDSLLAARLVAQLQERMGVELPLRSFFERPTVAGVARYIEVVSAIVNGTPSPGAVGENRERVEF